MTILTVTSYHDDPEAVVVVVPGTERLERLTSRHDLDGFIERHGITSVAIDPERRLPAWWPSE